MEKKSKDTMYVYLSLSGFKSELVAELEKKIGFKHTEFNKKGDPIGKTKLKYKENRWEYRVDASTDADFTLDKLISKIFKKFKNAKVLKSLSRMGRPEIVCVIHTVDCTPDLFISNKNLRIMADCGVSFWTDYYLFTKD